MAVTKKSLISNSTSKKTSKKPTKKPTSSPVSTAKLATAMISASKINVGARFV